jgi:hypothetical protein
LLLEFVDVRFLTHCVLVGRAGIYSWNWELPLNHQQVLSCHKTPPPELTRQQEALAAATAAAAAAAAVTAGATPDAIPNLPVVARMASLLGKRQHQQMAPMSAMPMGPPPMMFAPMPMDMSGMEAATGSMATSSAAAAAGTAVDSTVEAAAEDRVSLRFHFFILCVPFVASECSKEVCEQAC